MVAINFFLLMLANFFVFYSLIGIGLIFLVIGKYYSLRKKLSPAWVLLSIGVITTAFRSLVDISILTYSGLGFVVNVNSALANIGNPMFGILGSFLILSGLAYLAVEKTLETTILGRRREELRLIVEHLRQRYLKKKISEEDLKRLSAQLERELAEIEVKLEKQEAEKI